MLFETPCINRHTNKEDICQRAKCVSKSFKIEFSDEITELLLAKYWHDIDNVELSINEVTTQLFHH